jgi:hypothetical protein
MRRATTVLASIGAVLVAGCGLHDPYAEQDARTTGERPAREAQTTVAAQGRSVPSPKGGELPGTVPARLRQREPVAFPEAGTRPEETLALAARLYGNWTSATAPDRFRRIVAISVGDARAELRQTAASAGGDKQQTRAMMRSRSALEALVVRGRGEARTVLVVTRERVDGAGLPEQSERYRVTVARVERRGRKWVISGWTPQS